MKKSDIILAILAGLGTAWIFYGMIQEIEDIYVFGMDIKALSLFLYLILPIGAIFALWISNLIGKKFLFVPQAAKFLLIGILATLIDIEIFKGLELVSGLDTSVTRAAFKGVSFVGATFAKYWGNKFLAFEKKGTEKAGKELIQFYIVTLISLGMNVAVFSFLVNILGAQFGIPLSTWKTLCVILSGFIIFAWNFLACKFIVFKE